MGKFERFYLSLLLFAFAIVIYGVRKAEGLRGYELSKEITKVLIHTLEFADKNFPDEEFVDIGLTVFGNRDTLYINRIDKKITSDRNFTYRVEGYQISCNVKIKGNYYIVSCLSK